MKLDSRALPLLETFGLRAENAGVCLGSNRWSGSGPTIASINPANETLLARLASASAADVDAAIAAVLASGLRTADIKSEGMTATNTSQMGEAILKELQKLHA